MALTPLTRVQQGAAATQKAEQVARTLFDAALARGLSP